MTFSAFERGSGLSFSGPTATRETYVVLKAEETSSMLRIRNEDGREQVISSSRMGKNQ